MLQTIASLDGGAGFESKQGVVGVGHIARRDDAEGVAGSPGEFTVTGEARDWRASRDSRVDDVRAPHLQGAGGAVTICWDWFLPVRWR